MTGAIGVVILAGALGLLSGPVLAAEAVRGSEVAVPRAADRAGPARIARWSLVAGVLFALAAWWFVHRTTAGAMLASSAESLSDAPSGGARSSAPFVSSLPAFLAVLWFAGASLVLVEVDLRERRLPNRVVIPSVVAVAGLLALSVLAGILSGKPGWSFEGQGLPVLVHTLGGALALFALYLVLALAARGSLGAGDVKLAPLIGAVLGFFGGWGAVIAGTALAFLAAGLVALPRAARRERGAQLPFGPFMIAGCWIALALAEPIRAAWLR